MKQDELEFAISQYVDGTLPPLERAILEQRLASDESARKLLEEYREIDSAITSTIDRDLPLPKVNWDRFAAHISSQIDAIEEADHPAVTTYKMPWVGVVRYAAMAAAIAVAFTVGLYMNRPVNQQNNSVAVVEPAKSTGTATVAIVAPESPGTSAVASIQIEIGPSASYVAARTDPLLAGDFAIRPPTLIIANAQAPAQDTNAMPY